MYYVLMSRMPKNTAPSGSEAPRGGSPERSRHDGGILLYGWDSRSETWCGPDEPSRCSLPDRRLLLALRGVTGKSWYGRVHGCSSTGPAARFFAMVHDLSDCAVAAIYCDESKAGPAEIVAVLPAGRRARLRSDFAFEFLAFARFLGSLSDPATLRLHDDIAAAIASRQDSDTLVFSISSGLWPGDLDAVLSGCVEKVALALCQWMEGASAGNGNGPRGRAGAGQ